MGYAEQEAADSVREACHKKQLAAAQLDLLNWFMKLCGSGQTTGMIRKIVHNKYVELSGEGERA